ncbi:MAG: shikimate dehydrogenase [Chitinophagaceae bacterium]|nr:shikimate dehydrogenase [Chitinophagaceae bacterium]
MRRFGLIGYPLGHSFSKKYFTEKFEKEAITDSVYDVFPLEKIDGLTGLLQRVPDLSGLNVTIPHKEKVIGFLHEKSKVVTKTGACNCIKISNGKLSGHNTDVIGFQQSLVDSFPNLPSRALILGTGGASKAVEYVLSQLKIPYVLVSRKPSTNNLSYEQVTEAIVKRSGLIINTTPLGMSPHIVEAPPIPYQAIGSSHCLFDLIYNPAKTLFLTKGEESGAAIQNGLAMLIIQAEESWKIWNS